jgi:hypothetical protein
MRSVPRAVATGSQPSQDLVWGTITQSLPLSVLTSFGKKLSGLRPQTRAPPRIKVKLIGKAEPYRSSGGKAAINLMRQAAISPTRQSRNRTHAGLLADP